MKIRPLLAVLLLLQAASPAFADNGAVGSESWIIQARRSPAAGALLRSLANTGNFRRLPPQYIEFAGQILFPSGNPFPAGTSPTLRIHCLNQAADSIERTCSLDEKGGFYSILKKGQTYELSWAKDSGANARFAMVAVPWKSFFRLKRVFKYKPGQNSR